MKNCIALIACIILFATSGFAQKDETLLGRGKIKITGAWGGTMWRASPIDNNWGILRGGYGGVEINKDFLIGGGGTSTRGTIPISNSDDRFDLDYGGLYLGYAPKSYKSLHLTTSVMLGGGSVRRFVDFGVERENIFVVEPYIGAEVNVTRWFRLGAGGGYRLVSSVENLNLQTNDVSDFYVGMTMRFGWSWGKKRKNKEHKHREYKHKEHKEHKEKKEKKDNDW